MSLLCCSQRQRQRTTSCSTVVIRSRARTTRIPILPSVLFLLVVLYASSLDAVLVQAFAASSGGGNRDAGNNAQTLFDRFRPQCPAHLDSIRQFAPSLVDTSSTTTSNDEVWVAVYRSNNNQPSVLVRDEFLQAMRSATEGAAGGSSNTNGGMMVVDPSLLSTNSSNSFAAAPVAVGRLLRTTTTTTTTASDDNDDTTTTTTTSETFLMDSLRCILKKETTDPACDGGSEHTEALSVAIDTLVVHYLKQQQQQQSINNKSSNNNLRFEGCLRAKGTLVAAQLLQDRGFSEVTALARDMATHTSSLDGCLARYAARAARSQAVSPEARQRAVEIVSRLGRVDRDADLKAALREQRQQQADDDEVDPWAAMKRLI